MFYDRQIEVNKPFLPTFCIKATLYVTTVIKLMNESHINKSASVTKQCNFVLARSSYALQLGR